VESEPYATARYMPWFHVQFFACNALQFRAIIAGFPTRWKLKKPAVIAQKLQRVACNKLHMKPRLYRMKEQRCRRLSPLRPADNLSDDRNVRDRRTVVYHERREACKRAG